MAAVIIFRSYSLYFAILILTIGPSKIPIPVYADCIWYGECGHASFAGKTLNCPYNGPPKAADAKILNTLSKWCPHYFDNGMPTQTCCDVNQIVQLDTNFKVIRALLSRCPSCEINFLAVLCHLACSPHQSSFMEVLQLSTTNLGEQGISEVNIYLSKQSAHDIYASCKGMAGIDGASVIDMLCGRPVLACTPEIMYEFIGDVEQYSHFQMNFILTDSKSEKFTPLSLEVYKCQEAPTVDLLPCTCQDCKASCPKAAEFAKPPKYHVGEIFLSQFLIILCFILLLAALIPTLIYYHRWEAAFLAIPPHLRKLDCLSLFFLKIRLRLRRLEEFGAQMEEKMEYGYCSLGKKCAISPHIFLSVGSVLFIILSTGIIFIKQTTNPIELWASKTSKTRMDKEYFDNHFGPFYRTEQIIIKPLDTSKVYYDDQGRMVEFGPAFNRSLLFLVHDLQQSIERISANGITLKDICYAPMSPTFTAVSTAQCLILSIWGLYQDNITLVADENYLSQATECISNSFKPECLARWGGPVYPEIALGGFLSAPRDEFGLPKPEKATALIVTYLLKNYVDEQKQIPVKKWEEKFIELLKNWSKKHDDVKISFSSESSIENELERNSKADVNIIIISYITMFIYIIIFLGRCSKVKRCMIDGKISLGFFGLLIVLVSVSSSIGFFGYIGVPMTPIIVEVVPFLVLSIGVDNIFILVQAYDRLSDIPGETVADRTGRMLGVVGPSVTLTSLSECCAFFIGALSNMPAVKAFALYAGMALFIDFLFQITCFVSLIALDSKRLRKNRFDVLCCIKSTEPKVAQNSWILICFRKYYVPTIMHRYVRPVVLVFFITISFVSMYTYSEIKIGLNPELSMSKDSYVYEYLQDLNRYLSIGPPMYFVVKESNLEYAKPEVQNLFCASPSCDVDSLALQVFGASDHELSYIAKPVNSWVDDFFLWFSDDTCCKVRPNNTFCPHSESSCAECQKENGTHKRPSFEEFERYVSFFLQDDPDMDCPKSGHASYASGVNLKPMGNDSKGFLKYKIGSNYFMTYHTILKTSEDFYSALENAYKISENITRSLNDKISRMGMQTSVEVFPYSVFYVFYEQYLTLWQDGIQGILISFFAVFITTFLLVGLDIWSAVLVVLTIAMILNNLVGMMHFWNIELNALSLVNIVLAIGISVEFCSHITHFFIMTNGTDRISRASASLSEMGSSVFAGITVTKLIGITVLAFANSQIFQVFYFRMFFCIVLFGAAHGLIYHPVVLSYLGSDTHIYFVRKSLGERQKVQESFKSDEISIGPDTDTAPGKHEKASTDLDQDDQASTSKASKDVTKDKGDDKNYLM